MKHCEMIAVDIIDTMYDNVILGCLVSTDKSGT
jgi:hypothetical protein